MGSYHMTGPKEPWSTSQFAEPSPAVSDSYAPVYPNQSLRRTASDEFNHGFQGSDGRPTPHSRWNPKAWSKRNIIIASILAILIIVGVIVGAVLGTRSTKYPDYTYLHYSQTNTYQGSSFFDGFTFFNNYDPADGVDIIYDSKVDAEAQNVTGISASGRPYLQLNTTVPAEKNFVYAHSARLMSTATFDDGLFLFDVYHAPYGCAVWPAVWLTGPQETWPAGGEIDVIEAANKGINGVQTTLHTSGGCSMGVKRKMTGKSLQQDCHNTTNGNAGCGVQGSSSTYGEALNSAGGGVWALEWRSEGIRTWFFPRSSIPADVQAGIDTNSANPDPSKWAEPLADFPYTHCDVGSHFKNMTLVANIDTCGPFTDVTFNQQCGSGNCSQYIQDNPTAFGNAYWEFGAWKVFQASGSTKRRMF